MPTASENLRRAWGHYEEGGGEQRAVKFLTDAGYCLRADWMWDSPGRRPTERESSAVTYLQDEWDYGSLSGFMVQSGVPYRELGDAYWEYIDNRGRR